jgi:hypothetical protein
MNVIQSELYGDPSAADCGKLSYVAAVCTTDPRDAIMPAHPSSVDPVIEEGVHTSSLISPKLARLSNYLGAWISASFR